jgi:hypothetical protein
VFDEFRQTLTQRGRVLLTQVDFKAGPVETENDRLGGFTTVQIINQAQKSLLRHARSLRSPASVR